VSDSEYYSGGGEKTIAKTVILDKYLWSYLKIMDSNWNGQKWYVGTHGGTGFTHEMDVDIPGSALRALDHGFDRFYFYEKDEDHFETLVETLNEEKNVGLEMGHIKDRGERVARSNDPYVRVMNMDCNEGVRFLTDVAHSNAHWFTFVDPEKFSVERDLMEALCERGNMDILFNFQTTAFFRNTGENAEHAHNKVASNLGIDFPKDADSPDELVEWYRESIYDELGWYSDARAMISSGNNGWRYDLIFASQNGTAMKIMDDIFNGDIQNDVTNEIVTWRKQRGNGQEGLEGFIHVETPADNVTEDGQSSFDDF
jgi:three-Cys-motif partner protein